MMIALTAAGGAWVAVAAAAFLGRLVLATCLAAAAVALTALWLAHVFGAFAHGTVGAMLRAFGATRSEARRIIALMPMPLGPPGRDGGWLNEGTMLDVQVAPRDGQPGLRPTRVSVVRSGETLATIALSEQDIYARLDAKRIAAADS